MNIQQLSKQIGMLLHLRPIPRGVGQGGERLGEYDDPWRLDSVLESPTRLRLINQRTSHSFELEWDNIQERRSPHFLMLRCELTLRPDRVDIEPIHKGAPIRPRPAELVEALRQVSAAPILARKRIEQSFNGLLVRCAGRLASLNAASPTALRVGIIEDSDVDVFCEVIAADYPWLQLVKGGERLELVGALRFAEIVIELTDASVRQLPQP